MTEAYLLLTFDSTHHAIAAQKALSGLNVVVMPTLREISASCGMSLRFPVDRRADAAAKLAAAQIGGWHLYHVLQENGRVHCQAL